MPLLSAPLTIYVCERRFITASPRQGRVEVAGPDDTQKYTYYDSLMWHAVKKKKEKKVTKTFRFVQPNFFFAKTYNSEKSKEIQK